MMSKFIHNKVIHNIYSVITSCYCKKMDGGNSLELTSEINAYCEDEFYKNKTTEILIYLIGVLIMFTNLFINKIMLKLAKFTRYKSLNEKLTIITIGSFITSFINTSLIILILSGNVLNFNLSDSIVNGIPSLREIQSGNNNANTYDFDR